MLDTTNTPINYIKPLQNNTVQAPKEELAAPALSDSKEDKSAKKQKIALALAGLAALGVATFAILRHKKPEGTPQGISDEIEELVEKGIIKDLAKGESLVDSNKVEKGIKGLTKVEDLPHPDVLHEEILNADGNKIGDRFFFGAYKGVYNGQNVIVEEKNISSKSLHTRLRDGYHRLAFIKDAESGKIIDIRRLDALDRDVTSSVKKASGTIIKTSEKSVNEYGDDVVKTFKNGKLHSTQTTTLNPDKSRQIVVEYASGCGKTINIAADGTKSVTKFGEDKTFGL